MGSFLVGRPKTEDGSKFEGRSWEKMKNCSQTRKCASDGNKLIKNVKFVGKMPDSVWRISRFLKKKNYF